MNDLVIFALILALLFLVLLIRNGHCFLWSDFVEEFRIYIIQTFGL